MPAELILTNARVVTADRVINGTLMIRDGVIAALDEGNSQLPQAQDLGGDYLMPGLVELHTDNLEKHMTPRPGVDWPTASAVLTHDAQIIAAGITTVFDALSIGDINPRGKRMQQLPAMLDAVASAEAAGDTRAEHRLHLRCEVCHPDALSLFRDLVGHPLVKLVSVMDHSPGQRQFAREDKYREYYMGKYHLSAAEMDAFSDQQTANSSQYSDRQRLAVVEICQARGLALASHDDATLAHVEESAGLGMAIAEFPTTLEAAEASHARGLKVLMGAPNVVRGGSHSGNIAAADLAQRGVLDILSSDYYPASLLQAAFLLAAFDNSYDLPKAIATVSLLPAQAVGLDDRGEIRPGLRADLLQASDRQGQPVVRQVWRQGRRVF
ncbi:alpha-D-ribose 1-methylphosphonate 5-triphosphate diphosphatase [Pseudomonas sp. Choline-3u-10]|jgi:alpha-D-ribose 1-methylphosphonate 5-triphosphate diphosphatase|uniref:alpha-D-ribose 1-methylphosphonate 5-triphosphate diphosphatase n=1 Tax=Pseudomonadaceae TaxID=135621 RepID=UPI000618208E|nr:MULTISPECIES: alpha-D-ribose 1-methylphosphonate 5-triphosphate diphosphatase [Pseudomonadaceae]MAL35709.1 alpha-D-ribose 1-methylphosphonate 5-triphosphate diphosphatase [Pseudomonas sp.]MBU0947839.1 alpha-D-ribose 1-methylphosphonate 5-triphosphate diphosphatase [Gammaproteobacteria bacterium]KJJ61675.1 phosphonate metabolism protein PhnM [Pseudomonas sp. 10B238]MBK3796131.1 alpha-D-ribose 1-methylphosphonate 5-triphosphate diphosphatase [Stutzerimonas stutzeri]MBK3876633.1 alpha-D-ribose|tara:strand:- start:2671 stop:3816 length:1146 start_codon:yes stop_codon:yes gene_type:complete